MGSSSVRLKQMIQFKEAELKLERKILKYQFRVTCKSLSPAYILKDTLREIESSSGIKKRITDTAVDLAANFVSKNILRKKETGPVLRIAGSVLKDFITSKLLRRRS